MIHKHVLCQPGCALTRENYDKDLRQTAVDAYREALRKIGGRDDFTVVEARRPGEFEGASLTSPDLRDRHLVLVTPRRFSFTETGFLYKKIIEALMPSTPGWSDCRIELLLWCTVCSRNGMYLKVTLDNHPYVIPKCILGALLRRCVDFKFEEGVYLLLQYGTHPDAALGRQIRDIPLVRLCYSGQPIREVDLLFTHGRSKHPATQSIETMVRCLVESGASLNTPHPKSRELPIHFISHLAVRSKMAAHIVVFQTPPKALTYVPSYISRLRKKFGIIKANPIEMTFLDAALASSGEQSDRQFKVANIIDGAVLPLLRSGVLMERDPFRAKSLLELRAIVRFCMLSWLVPGVAGVNWPGRIFDLLVDLRGSSSIDIETCSNHLKRLDRFGWSSYALRFLDNIKTRYPLSLRQLTRRAVLKQLPVGFIARHMALSKLNFSNNLVSQTTIADFLFFSEYNDLVDMLNF